MFINKTKSVFLSFVELSNRLWFKSGYLHVDCCIVLLAFKGVYNNMLFQLKCLWCYVNCIYNYCESGTILNVLYLFMTVQNVR